MSHSSAIPTAASVPAALPPAAPAFAWSPAQVGMIVFLASEVSFFSTLLVAHLTLNSQPSDNGPGPLALSLTSAAIGTACLVVSSICVHAAELQLHRGAVGRFRAWWGAGLLLGVGFLALTAMEWSELIRDHGLTISRDLFGTTFYTVVGFHALHVTCGVIALLIVLCVVRIPSSLRNKHDAHHTAHPVTGVQLVGWYWHFVDVVWIVVVAILYVAPRLTMGGGAP